MNLLVSHAGFVDSLFLIVETAVAVDPCAPEKATDSLGTVEQIETREKCRLQILIREALQGGFPPARLGIPDRLLGFGRSGRELLEDWTSPVTSASASGIGLRSGSERADGAMEGDDVSPLQSSSRGVRLPPIHAVLALLRGRACIEHPRAGLAAWMMT